MNLPTGNDFFSYFSFIIRLFTNNNMDKLTDENIKERLNEFDCLLLPTHNKLSLPLINRIYRKMMHGIKFNDIKVTDTLLLDGHHRYVASLMASIELGTTKSATTSATVQYNWESIQFVDEEWESKKVIKKFNKKGAKANNVSVDFLRQLTEN